MAKKIYRIPPCPAYDIAGTESWLEDMAQEGLFPEQLDHPINRISFRQGEPQPVRYRIEPAHKPRRIFDDDDTPPRELRELAREFGWTFLSHYGSFYVYQSISPDAREMNTDPEVQAMTLKVLKKQWLRSLILNFIYAFLLFFILMPGFFLHMATYGSILIVLFLGLLGLLLGQLSALYHIHRLYRSLSSGTAMNHHKDWRKGARIFKAGHILQYVMLALLLVGQLHTLMVNFDLYEEDLSKYPGMPPFVTLDELVPEDRDVTIEHINNGAFTRKIDPLIPLTLTWLDGGSVTYSDGTKTGGLLEVQYCEAITPWLAKAIAKDYLDVNRLHYETNAIPLSDLGLDYACGYYDEYGLSRVALAKGSTVVCARLSMGDAYGHFTLENWTEKMVQRLTEGQ